jgi:hypothetical protein
MRLSSSRWEWARVVRLTRSVALLLVLIFSSDTNFIRGQTDAPTASPTAAPTAAPSSVPAYVTMYFNRDNDCTAPIRYNVSLALEMCIGADGTDSVGQYSSLKYTNQPSTDSVLKKTYSDSACTTLSSTSYLLNRTAPSICNSGFTYHFASSPESIQTEVSWIR